jgi:Molybdopterin oxidoreductase
MQSLKSLENSHIFLFIGVNLRLEAPVLNAKIRKSYLEGSNFFNAYTIGVLNMVPGYPIHNIGCSLKSYVDFFLGRTKFFKQMKGLTYKFN